VPIQVLVLTPFYPTDDNDASGCFVAEPVKRLRAFGVGSRVLAVQPIYNRKPVPSKDTPEASWTRYFALPYGVGLASSGAFLFAALISKVRELHHRAPIQIIHAHAALPCGHAATLLSRELGIPFVVTVHGLDAFATRQVKGLPGKWCANVSRHVYHAATRVICISERVREQVIQGVSTSCQTAVVYNGVDTALFFPNDRPDASSTEVLSVGNLIPTKGHALLLNAMAGLQPRYPQLTCTIIGQGPELQRLKILAARLGITSKVSFRGLQSRKHLAETMRRCTMFVLPSSYEGLGCVYLEAMASEKAVIGCRDQGIEEVIEHGRNGLLARAENVNELAAAISLLLERPQFRQQMAIAGRQTIAAGFTLDHQAEQLSLIYQESLA
jgi:glycosyltransferase involved in cell wall biosynthesis